MSVGKSAAGTVTVNPTTDSSTKASGSSCGQGQGLEVEKICLWE